jgi:hypothetical protein
MGFQTYVETPHRLWTIQQTWNADLIQFVRVAVKGPQRVEQGAMTYPAFLHRLDVMDGHVSPPAAAQPPKPPSVPVSVPPAPAPEPLPSHPSLFGEAL